MIDSKRLKAAMVLTGIKQKDVQEKAGIPRSRFYKVLNNGQSYLTAEEIYSIAKMMSLNDIEIVNIFFADEVSNQDTIHNENE